MCVVTPPPPPPPSPPQLSQTRRPAHPVIRGRVETPADPVTCRGRTVKGRNSYNAGNRKGDLEQLNELNGKKLRIGVSQTRIPTLQVNYLYSF